LKKFIGEESSLAIELMMLAQFKLFYHSVGGVASQAWVAVNSSVAQAGEYV